MSCNLQFLPKCKNVAVDMSFYYRLFIFLFGVIIGVFLAFWVEDDKHIKVTPKLGPILDGSAYKKWFEAKKLTHRKVEWDDLKYSKKKFRLESDYLLDRISVACIILIKDSKYTGVAAHTWARGCNLTNHIHLPNYKTPVLPGKARRYTSSWDVLCMGLLMFPPEFDWMVIARERTFVILENLRFFVAGLDPHDSYYFGHATTFWGHDYNSGDAGIVISRGAFELLQNEINNFTTCTQHLTYWNREDFYLGKHLASLKIFPVDTRDEFGLSTFHPYSWYHSFFPGETYYQNSKYEHKCCSKHSITFQVTSSDQMYTYKYLFYHLQVFIDGKLGNQPFNNTVKDEEIWGQFLKERNLPTNISSEQYYKVWEDLIDDPNSFGQNMKREKHSDL